MEQELLQREEGEEGEEGGDEMSGDEENDAPLG